jgi:hypothetical protein
MLFEAELQALRVDEATSKQARQAMDGQLDAVRQQLSALEERRKEAALDEKNESGLKRAVKHLLWESQHGALRWMLTAQCGPSEVDRLVLGA